MARGTTLAQLRSLLKAELAIDSDSSVAPGGDDVLNGTLSGQQRWLACEYDWPFLEIRCDIPLVAGQRYYGFPNTEGIETLNMEREIRAECYWSNLWYSVENGIKLLNYNTFNPELNQRLDPVLKWQPYNGTGATVQFEVWPLPATATRLRLTGQRALNQLVSDNDKADLDDLLIVLFSAAELSARYGDQAAAAKAKRAEMRLNRLRAGIVGPNKVFSMRGSAWDNHKFKNEIRPMVGVNYTPPS